MESRAERLAELMRALESPCCGAPSSVADEFGSLVCINCGRLWHQGSPERPWPRIGSAYLK